MKRLILVMIALLVPATMAMAQEPVAVLEFFEDEFELQILDDNGFDVEFFLGMGLNPGDRVVTQGTSVEIRMQPNGSIVRVAPDTNFSIESIQGRDAAAETRMSVTGGRLRMVAARVTGTESRYSVRTPTAVAGVRGTDFGVDVVPGTDTTPPAEELFVFEGEVLFESDLSDTPIFLTQGQRANVFAEEFAPQQMTPQEIAERQEGLGFQALNASDVPGQAPEPEPQQSTSTQDADTGSIAGAIGGDGGQLSTDEPSGGAEAGPGDEMFARLAEILGLQVGSVTINNETFATVVFQPRVALGPLQLALYLPVTYRDNLFDPSGWYRPKGNDEWSFGLDQDWQNNPLGALADLGTDVALKIRSLEYNTRSDPFFVKVGNLSNFSIGQGLLMRNYANDGDFPSVRRIGFNLGVDRGGFGFEAMVNDLAEPEIMGGRLFFRPVADVFPAAIGFSAITDLYPAGGYVATSTSATSIDAATKAQYDATAAANPAFINVAADLVLPFIDTSILGIIGFAEAGGLLPYVRNPATYGGNTVNAGLRYEQLVNLSTGEVSNVGWMAGFRGRVLFVDYRLDFRSFNGTFRPSFFNAGYDRQRLVYANDMMVYLANPTAASVPAATFGVAGEASASIFDLADVAAGYFWPWEITDSGQWRGASDDEFLLTVTLNEGLIPLGIEAGLQYRRTGFAATIAQTGDFSGAQLFDANTTVDGFLSYPVNDFVDLVARVSNSVVRDDAGNISYDAAGRPRYAPVVTIQTQIGF